MLAAIGVAALLVIALEEIVHRSFGERLSAMPVTVTIISNALLLFLTYVVLDEVISRREAARWRQAAIDVIVGIKQHGDQIDRDVFQIVRRYIAAQKIKGAPTTGSTRAERNSAVLQYLPLALQDTDSFLVPKTEDLAESMDEVMQEMQDSFRWGTVALTSVKEFHELVDSFPELRKRSAALVRKLKTAINAASTSKGCTPEKAAEVLAAWQAYEQARAATSELAMPFILAQGEKNKQMAASS